MPIYDPYNEDYQLEAEYEAYCQAEYEAYCQAKYEDYLEAQEEDYIYNSIIIPQYFADLDAEQNSGNYKTPLTSKF